MSDMGVKYDTGAATKGMAEGNPQELENVHDPGRQGTEVRRPARRHPHRTGGGGSHGC